MKGEGAGMKQLAVIEKDHCYISAVLEDQQLDNVIVEETSEDSLLAGDIYVCRVSHIVQNINAAFVEVQKDVMCYLPMEKNRGASEKIVQGMEFAVQVKKAAVKSKQAVVSRKLEFAGRFAVVTTENLSQSMSPMSAPFCKLLEKSASMLIWRNAFLVLISSFSWVLLFLLRVFMLMSPRSMLLRLGHNQPTCIKCVVFLALRVSIVAL